MTDPGGRRVEALLEPRGDGAFRCSYRPAVEGNHSVGVSFGGAPIPRSPFVVGVGQGERRGGLGRGGGLPHKWGDEPEVGGCPISGGLSLTWGAAP